MKKKTTTGANDRAKDETIAQTGEGLPDDSSSVLEFGSEGATKVRGEDENADRRPGPTVDAEDPDKSEADHSPARQKDRARDEPKTAGTSDAGPNEDTYD